MIPVTLKKFRSIKDIDREVWNCLVPSDNAAASWEFLKVVEDSEIENVDFYYFLFFQDGNLLGQATAHTMTLSASNLLNHGSRNLVEKLGRLQKFRFLVCGNFISDGLKTIFFSSEVFLPQIITLLNDQLWQISKERKLKGVLYKEFDKNEVKDLSKLIEFGFNKVLSIPSHHIQIRWNSLEDYKISLNRKYRQSFTKNRSKINNPRIKITTTKDHEWVNKRLYELYRYVHNRAKYRIETMNPRFFRQFLAQDDKKGFILTIRKDELVIGFACFLENTDSIQALYLGYDETLNRQHDIYFNILFGLLEEAIIRKKKFLFLGQTADSFKSRMGCEYKDKYFYFRLRNPINNWLIKKFSDKIFEYPEIQNKNVFKKNKRKKL